MKGIVVEIRNKDVVVLSDEGNVMKMKNNNYQVGEEVQLSSYNKKSKVKFITLVASFIIAFTAIGRGVYAYTTPYSYVSLDVNPSMEYHVNVFGRVIDAKGVNKEGEEIIGGINVKNKSINQVIKDTIDKVTEQGFINDGETGGIVIATSSDNEAKAEELADELKADIEKVIDENNLVADVEAFSVSEERVREAKELGVTPGKLNLVEKLQNSVADPDDISIDKWINKPVKEIMEATKSNKEEQKTKIEEDINNNKEPKEGTPSETSNEKDKVEKETKNTNENKSSNIAENKATNDTPVENKATGTVSNGNKLQGVKANAEKSDKKAK